MQGQALGDKIHEGKGRAIELQAAPVAAAALGAVHIHAYMADFLGKPAVSVEDFPIGHAARAHTVSHQEMDQGGPQARRLGAEPPIRQGARVRVVGEGDGNRKFPKLLAEV